jgi:hypothetical protein
VLIAVEVLEKTGKGILGQIFCITLIAYMSLTIFQDFLIHCDIHGNLLSRVLSIYYNDGEREKDSGR